MVRSLKDSFTFAFYLIFSPFKGFWELKAEKKGNVRSASVIVLLYIIASVLSVQFTGVFFATVDRNSYNILFETAKILAVILIWCTSQWCLTTLMDGEGTFPQIYVATAYALIPLTVMKLFLVILSNVFSLDEAVFYQLLNSFSLVWTGFLLFVSVLVTQQYKAMKTFFTIVLSIVGMAAITFIGLLVFDLIQQIGGFLLNVYFELSLRA